MKIKVYESEIYPFMEEGSYGKEVEVSVYEYDEYRIALEKVWKFQNKLRELYGEDIND